MNKQFILRISLIAIAVVLALIGNNRPVERIANIQTPDTIHIHQVYAKNPIQVQFTSKANGLSAIAISKKTSNNQTQIVNAHIYNDQHIEIPSKLNIAQTELRLSFKVQAQSKNRQYITTIEAANASKQHALLLPYESDSTKYPETIVRQNEIKKQGSIGITEYEKPTVAVLVAQWLALPHQKPLWVGVILFVIGLSFRPPSRNPRRLDPGSRPGMTMYYIVIFLSIMIVYWPATKLFFYSDDVPILARTEVLKKENVALLFTPYQYRDTDTQSKFGFDFYRPVSFTAYPLLLSLLPGTPNASLYYSCNLILFAITGCLLFTIANYILRSHSAALFATAIWAFSSSKLGLLYWWSSSQDILASLFTMVAIMLYLKDKRKLSLVFYVLGIFSKEYIIVTPLIIAGIELLDASSRPPSRDPRGFRVKPGMTARLSTFIITAGIFLIVNTAMLGNPFIPQGSKANTYSLTLQPIAIARNILVYTSASVESRLWPTNTATQSIETWLSGTFELWRAKTAGPYYPGIIIIAGILVVLFSTWKNVFLRNSILFGAAWWILYLGPILLFANDWKPRWLTLSIMGIGIIVAVIAREIRIPRIVLILCSALIAIYGFTIARDSQLTRFYREQSDYTQNAYHQLRDQQQNMQNIDRIILVGIAPEQKTSLNAYLFRVYAKNPQADIMYVDSIPANTKQGDIIINMSGNSPYYPESEK